MSKEGSGLTCLLRDQRNDELAKIYHAYSKLPESLKSIAGMLEVRVSRLRIRLQAVTLYAVSGLGICSQARGRRG